MRVPRDLSGHHLAKALSVFGYRVSRQTGSHIRLETEVDGTHKITIPAHDPLKIGTLRDIIRDLCEHHNLNRDELLKRILS